MLIYSVKTASGRLGAVVLKLLGLYSDYSETVSCRQQESGSAWGFWPVPGEPTKHHQELPKCTLGKTCLIHNPPFKPPFGSSR